LTLRNPSPEPNRVDFAVQVNCTSFTDVDAIGLALIDAAESFAEPNRVDFAVDISSPSITDVDAVGLALIDRCRNPSQSPTRDSPSKSVVPPSPPSMTPRLHCRGRAQPRLNAVEIMVLPSLTSTPSVSPSLTLRNPSQSPNRVDFAVQVGCTSFTDVNAVGLALIDEAESFAEPDPFDFAVQVGCSTDVDLYANAFTVVDCAKSFTELDSDNIPFDITAITYLHCYCCSAIWHAIVQSKIIFFDVFTFQVSRRNVTKAFVVSIFGSVSINIEQRI